MKLLRKLALLWLTLVAVAALQGCSTKAATELLDTVGDDAVAVAVVKPLELLASAGASVGKDGVTLPRDLQSDTYISRLARLRGVDTELMASAAYKDVEVLSMAIRDNAEFGRSVKKTGMTKTNVAGFEAFFADDSSDGSFVFIDGDVAFWSYASGAAARERAAKSIMKHLEKPLQDWKREKLAADTGAVAFVACFDKSTGGADMAVAGTIKLDGAKASLSVESFDNKGQAFDAVSAMKGAKALTLGRLADRISASDNLCFAIGGFEGATLGSLLSEGVKSLIPYQMQSAETDEALDNLTGAAFASIYLPEGIDPADASMFDYNFSVGVGTERGYAAKALSRTVAQVRSLGLPVSGSGHRYAVTVTDDLAIEAEASDGFLTVSNSGYKARPAVKGIADCYIYAAVNFPPQSALLLEAGIPFGLKGYVKVMADSADAQLEITGSDRPFIASLINIVKRVH